MATTSRAVQTAERREPAAASRGGLAFALRLNLFAVFLTAFWTPLNTLLLPGMAEPLAPESLRGSALGGLTLVGVGIAVLVQPLFGAWSDRWRSPERRRLPMVVAAALAGPLLVAMWFAPNFAVLLLVYVVLQCAMNLAQAAFQALIPDVAPQQERSGPSGVKTALDVGGNAAGLGIAGGLILIGAGEVAIMWSLVGLCAGGAVIAWKTAPGVRPAERLEPLRSPLAVFKPLFKGDPEFRNAVRMRFLFLLGIYPVQRFILLMLEDRYQVEEPLARASVFIVICIAVAAIAGFAAGMLDDHMSTQRLSQGATVVAAGALLGIAFAPTLGILAIAGIVLAAAAGAFQAVNWGVLAKSLKDTEAARYFGLANVATAGASALAGGFGPLVDVSQRFVPGATYQVLFVICALISVSALWPAKNVPANNPA